MSSQPVNVKELFKNAHTEGDLSSESMKTLTLNADIGAQIQAGLGVRPDDVPASEVVLVTLMPDDSGSIRFGGNAKAVRDGHNQVLDALVQSRQEGDVLVHTRYLNGHVLFPYRPLGSAVRMDKGNYNPSLGTPLYDQMAVLLGTVMAKTREFEDSGVPVRSVTLVITDGAEQHSRHQTAASVRALVEDMQKSETHIVAAMGIDDGSTPFREVFRELGIRDEWILTPKNTANDVRAAFHVFSQSVVSASRCIASFSQTALRGFVVN